MKNTLLRYDRHLLQSFLFRELQDYREFRSLSKKEQMRAVVKYYRCVLKTIAIWAEKYTIGNVRIISLTNLGVDLRSLTLRCTYAASQSNPIAISLNLPPGDFGSLPFQKHAYYGIGVNKENNE